MTAAALWLAWALFTLAQNVVRVWSSRAKNSASYAYCAWTTALDALLFAASFVGIGAGALAAMRGRLDQFAAVALAYAALCALGSLAGQAVAMHLLRNVENGEQR